jgi:phosphatidate cytidylyltransferase
VNERRQRAERPPERRAAEGVRIIRADEAQAALDAGEATGRRPNDQLRYGDVPPAPSGPRPPHRFPLPDSIDPAGAVALPRLAVPMRAEEPRADGPDDAVAADRATESVMAGPPGAEPPADGDDPAEPGGPAVPTLPGEAFARPETPRPAPPPTVTSRDQEADGGQGGWGLGDRTAELGLPGEPVATEAGAPAAPPMTPADEGITVTGGGTDLPHWTDPPTGEVPRILAGEASTGEAEDDLEAWNALGNRGIRWRDEGDDWSDVDELSDLAADHEPVGILDPSRAEHSDIYSFDEEFERVEAERSGSHPALADFDEEFATEPSHARTGGDTGGLHSRSGAHRASGRVSARASGGRSGDELVSRVVIGAGLILLLIIAYAIGSKALVVLAAAVVVAAAAEAYGMLQRSGFRPATLLGLVGTAGVVFASYWKGVEAIPLVTVLVFAGAMMWYLLRIVEARPLANVAVTTMGFVWIGVLGSYSALMLRAAHGKGLFLGAVLVAVAADVGAFLVGRWIGSRPMAASISPAKTIEGFVGGLVAAIIVGAIVGKEITPWGGMKHGLLLGLVAGLVAAAGDLFESMIKRDLGIKDSAGTLMGHGGLLDRFDSLLLVLPASYYLATLFHIVK